MEPSTRTWNTEVQKIEAVYLQPALCGDAEAFAQLVEAYQRPVYNMCYRMLNNPEDAEDAAQETFLRAFKSLGNYDNSRSFGTWLLSIAAHYCIDQIRKRRMVLMSLDTNPDIEIPDNVPGPEKLASRHEEQKKVQGLLKVLAPTDRAAVVMYYWYDLSYDEIAKTLSLTVSAVKSRLHRARRELAMQCNQDLIPQISVERNRYESPAF